MRFHLLTTVRWFSTLDDEGAYVVISEVLLVREVPFALQIPLLAAVVVIVIVLLQCHSAALGNVERTQLVVWYFTLLRRHSELARAYFTADSTKPVVLAQLGALSLRQRAWSRLAGSADVRVRDHRAAARGAPARALVAGGRPAELAAGGFATGLAVSVGDAVKRSAGVIALGLVDTVRPCASLTSRVTVPLAF